MVNERRPLQGHVGAPVTPFQENGDLDVDTLRKLVEFQIREGADCLALMMHLGENLKLNAAEFRQVVEISIETAAQRVPTYVHVSSGGTRNSIELAEHAETVGADGVIAMPPYHWRSSDQASFEHFRAIAGAIAGGLVVYSNPNATGSRISFQVIEELLATCDNFVGLKDAGFDIRYFTEVCRITAEAKAGFNPMTGVEFILPAAAVGATGTFSLTGAVAPRALKQLVELSLAGRFDEALPLQRQMAALCVLLEDPGYPRKVKAAMEIMGRGCGPLRAPREPLSDKEYEEIRKKMDSLGFLDTEPHGW